MNDTPEMNICPICRGKGKLPSPKYNPSDISLKKEMAKILIKNRFSYRQVAKFLKYKSANSITNLLK